MIRELQKHELVLVSGGNSSSDTREYFDDTSAFDGWLTDIDFDLGDQMFEVTIYDSSNFDVSFYADFDVDFSGVQFEGAGVTFTLSF